MLVCNVSLRPPRSAIAATIAELTEAVDAIASGEVVFAALVDDPASVGDIVDAYLGEIMVETASATDAFSLSLVYDAAVDETVTANDVTDATGVVYTKWNSATIAGVTLSGGDLVVTNTSTAGETGARSSAGKTSGKYYFEITLTTEAGGGNTGFGIATTSSTYTAMGNNATTGTEVFLNGGIWTNGSTSSRAIGNPVSGQVIGIAIDLDNRKAWFRNWTDGGALSGEWNGQVIGVQDPATNTGGVAIPAGTMAPICTFNGVTGNVFTANFGATAFVGTVPSGFTSGWTT